MQVYLPDDLYDEVKQRQLPASELLQHAVRAEIERQVLIENTDRYLAELAAEVGQPSARDRTRAEAVVHGIRDRTGSRAS